MGQGWGGDPGRWLSPPYLLFRHLGKVLLGGVGSFSWHGVMVGSWAEGGRLTIIPRRSTVLAHGPGCPLCLPAGTPRNLPP